MGNRLSSDECHDVGVNHGRFTHQKAYDSLGYLGFFSEENIVAGERNGPGFMFVDVGRKTV
jgi:hypothetical protein